MASVVGTIANATPPPRDPTPWNSRVLAQPVAVFGSDDRTAVPQSLQWIAERLGLLFNNQLGTVCSAFCVADNVIATAAHCVRGQNPAAVRFSDFSFARNYDRSRVRARIEGAETGSAAQHVMTGDFRLRVRPPIDAANDWALLRLPKNSCPDRNLELRTIGPDALVEASKAGRVFQISYHRDFALWRPALGKPCSVARDFANAPWQAIASDFIDAERIILHTCDTGGASSGSPLLMDTDNGPVIVGINVGTYEQSRIVTPKTGTAVRQLHETVANTAIHSEAFATHIETLRSAQILASGPPLRDLQERLGRQSLYSGRLDGSYGPALKSAIEGYEKASKLPVTGLPTIGLVQRLAQDAGRRGEMAPTSTTDQSQQRRQ